MVPGWGEGRRLQAGKGRGAPRARRGRSDPLTAPSPSPHSTSRCTWFRTSSWPSAAPLSLVHSAACTASARSAARKTAPTASCCVACWPSACASARTGAVGGAGGAGGARPASARPAQLDFCPSQGLHQLLRHERGQRGLEQFHLRLRAARDPPAPGPAACSICPPYSHLSRPWFSSHCPRPVQIPP